MKQPLSLKQVEFRQRLIAFIVPGMMCAISIGVLLVGIVETNKVIKKRQDLATIKLSTMEKVAFNQFVVSNTVNLENLNQVVPNEAMMIGVIQDFESVIKQFDPLGVAEIATVTPVKIGAYSAITLNIKITTPLENLPQLLDSINKLPYMTQLINSESNLAGESFKHQLSLRLYVQEPFNTP